MLFLMSSVSEAERCSGSTADTEVIPTDNTHLGSSIPGTHWDEFPEREADGNYSRATDSRGVLRMCMLTVQMSERLFWRWPTGL